MIHVISSWVVLHLSSRMEYKQDSYKISKSALLALVSWNKLSFSFQYIAFQAIYRDIRWATLWHSRYQQKTKLKLLWEIKPNLTRIKFINYSSQAKQLETRTNVYINTPYRYITHAMRIKQSVTVCIIIACQWACF